MQQHPWIRKRGCLISALWFLSLWIFGRPNRKQRHTRKINCRQRKKRRNGAYEFYLTGPAVFIPLINSPVPTTAPICPAERAENRVVIAACSRQSATCDYVCATQNRNPRHHVRCLHVSFPLRWRHGSRKRREEFSGSGASFSRSDAAN